MPDRPSPHALLQQVAASFELTNVTSVVPWPFLPQDRRAMTRLIARFQSNDRDLVLKARTAEHRGTASLAETQRLQMELKVRGVATPALLPTKEGGFLTKGINPRDASDPHYEVLRYVVGPGYFDVLTVCFEVQEVVSGTVPNEDADWHRIGEACGHLHRIGYQPEARSYDPSESAIAAEIIDTFLPNKFYYARSFRSRSVKRGRDILQHKFGGELDRQVQEIVERGMDLPWRRDLTSYFPHVRDVIFGQFGGAEPPVARRRAAA